MGLMYGRLDLLDSLRPYKVSPASSLSPHRWETGTGNHEAMAGLVAAVDYLARRAPGQRGDRRALVIAGMNAIAAHERELSSAFLHGVASVPHLRLFGIDDPARAAERTPTFALRLGDIPPRTLAEELGARGIFTWDGNYYAEELMQRLGLEDSGGAVRIGFCHLNVPDEVDRVLQTLTDLAA
jgi:selenocysteine lyase/cysteine desulfurase